MKDKSPKMMALKESIRADHEVIFQELNAVLTNRGLTGVRMRGFSLESASECKGGVPKVPRQVLKNGRPVTVWVCP